VDSDVSGYPWAAFYDDKRVVTWQDCLPQDTPHWGLIAIGQRTERIYPPVLCDGRKAWLYRADLGHWQEPDDAGFIDILVHHAHDVTAVRYGRMINTEMFRELWAQAREFAHG
jgi:hypothetical protein